MKLYLTALLLAVISVVAQAEPRLSVEDGWVRMVPPISANSAAYFMLHNTGDTDVELIGVESNIASAVEMHTVVEVDGLMSMQPLEKITVPAKDCVLFQPGSHHVMLIGLKQPLQENQKVPMKLRFSDGESLQLDLTVKNEGDDEDEAIDEHVLHHH